MAVWAVLTLALIWPTLARLRDDAPNTHAPLRGGVNYLVVAPEYLERSAQEWANFRRLRGYVVRVVLIPAEQTTFEYIRDSIQRSYLESGRPYPFYVLLLGHAHAASSFPDSYLPTGHWQIEPLCEQTPEVGIVCLYDQVAGDDVYAMNPELAATPYPMAIGRIPARTNEEVLRILERTRSYEMVPPVGVGRTQIEVLTSASGLDRRFDWLVERVSFYFVQSHLPVDYRWHLLSGGTIRNYSYPAMSFSGEVARRMDQGALAVLYFGHGLGTELGWAVDADGTMGRIFGVDDVPLLQGAQRSVVAVVSCLAGEYDTDGNTASLAEAMLLAPSGPVATYAASRMTGAVGNSRLGKELLQVLLSDQAPTVGEWIVRAETNYRNPGADQTLELWTVDQAGPWVIEWVAERIYAYEGEPLTYDAIQRSYLEHQLTYNLFGDPALALAYPRPQLHIAPQFVWQPIGRVVRFSGHGDVQPGQTVMVTLEAPPTSHLPRDEASNDDVVLTYEWANERIVSRVNVVATASGEFAGEIALPPGLPGGWYLLKVLTVNGSATLTGSTSIYLGMPPIGRILVSTPFLWGLVTALLLRSGVVMRKQRRTGPYVIEWAILTPEGLPAGRPFPPANSRGPLAHVGESADHSRAGNQTNRRQI